MNRKPEAKAVRNQAIEVIAGLEKENKMQDQLIREQKTMIRMLEHQIIELRKLLEHILKA